jgi:hypothetical protein
MSEGDFKWVRDTTGRFPRRPWYTQAYLDRRCEEILFEFLNRLYGQITVPVPTGTIIKLIERDAADLDMYADLSAEGDGVEGVTYFFASGKPKVRIIRTLSEQSHRAHRLRNTLAHEYAHVWLHSELWRDATISTTRVCRGEDVVSETVVDWLEWQASYCAAALLMPKGRVELLVGAYSKAHGENPYEISSPKAIGLEQRVAEAFDVSQQAAGVRLSQLGYIRVARSKGS